MQTLINYLNKLWENTISPTITASWKRNDDSTAKLVDAINNSKAELSVDSEEISRPIVNAVAEVTEAVSKIELPETKQVNNTADLQGIISQLKSLNKKDPKIIVKNDLNKALAMFKSNKDKGELIKAVKDIKIPESKDYTDLLTTIASKEFDTSKLEKLLENLAPTETATIEELLTKLVDKNLSKYENRDGRIRVEVDRAGGGGGGGLTPTEATALEGVSTEATLINVLAKLQEVADNTDTLEVKVGDVTLNTEGLKKDFSVRNKAETATHKYVGFEILGKGEWKIMRITLASNEMETLYATGTADYLTNWVNRLTLTYS